MERRAVRRRSRDTPLLSVPCWLVSPPSGTPGWCRCQRSCRPATKQRRNRRVVGVRRVSHTSPIPTAVNVMSSCGCGIAGLVLEVLTVVVMPPIVAPVTMLMTPAAPALSPAWLSVTNTPVGARSAGASLRVADIRDERRLRLAGGESRHCADQSDEHEALRDESIHVLLPSSSFFSLAGFRSPPLFPQWRAFSLVQMTLARTLPASRASGRIYINPYLTATYMFSGRLEP